MSCGKYSTQNPPLVSISMEASYIPPPNLIFGQTTEMSGLKQRIERVSVTSVPILIVGEPGTGKKALARFIHNTFPQNDNAFVEVNCTGVSGPSLERELFGYEQENSTGSRIRSGKVDTANRGTLYLDEVGELTPSIQARLVQVLREGKFAPVGGRETCQVEVRLICATGKDLKREMAAGRFRQDLYYRINVVYLPMPPLRSRRADIAGLVEYFVSRYGAEYCCKPNPVSPQLMQIFMHHHWPGNIRELENMIRRYVILGSEQNLVQELLNVQPAGTTSCPGDGLSLKARMQQAVRDTERQIILDVLQMHNWNRRETARALNISYRTLFNKLKTVGLPPKRRSVRQDVTPQM